mmetsp:Transcript_36801/g.45469  ORF Transcript_36801/g.45469 Transcript_36801/m.45469 type:complete len:83 (+) Transcript_36801:481-729(+)
MSSSDNNKSLKNLIDLVKESRNAQIIIGLILLFVICCGITCCVKRMTKQKTSPYAQITNNISDANSEITDANSNENTSFLKV